MNNLKNERPEVYQHFQDGNFVVRRSDRYWAGLPADQVIEQTLMRSLKTSGGLTRGSGMSDIQRAVWLLSMPVCFTNKDKMEENISKSQVNNRRVPLPQGLHVINWIPKRSYLTYKKLIRSQIPTLHFITLQMSLRQTTKLTYLTLFLLGEKYWKRWKVQKYLQYLSKNVIKSKL